MTSLSRTDILLLRYAAGCLDTGGCIVVITLLAFNEDARRKVEAFEALGGQIIQEEIPASVSAECLEIVLRRIEAPPRLQTPLECFLELFSRF